MLFEVLLKELLLIPLIVFSYQIIPPSYFNVGVMFPIQKFGLPAPSIKHFAAIMMAFEDINNKSDGIYDYILPQTQLRNVVRSPNNGFYFGAFFAKDMLSVDSNKGVKVNIGPYGDLAMQGSVPTFKEFGYTPVIGYYDRSSTMCNSIAYPNLMRLIPSIYYDAYAISSLISKYFQWNKVTIFSTNTDDGRASSTMFRYYATKFKIQILSSHTIDEGKSDLSYEINKAKNVGARIFVLFTDTTVGMQLIEEGQRMKLFTSNTQIIGGEKMSLSSSWKSLNIPIQNLTSLLNGFIGVKYRAYAPSSKLKSQFLQRWINHKTTNGYINEDGNQVCDKTMDYYKGSYLYQYYPNDDKSKSPICAGINFTSYKNTTNHPNLEYELDEMMYAYDATITAALGLHHMIYDMNMSNPTSSDLRKNLIYNTSFDGLTGKVSFMTEIQDFNVGGRKTEILYEIVNFISPNIINSENLSNVDWNDVFPTILYWHSEKGFTSCESQDYFPKLYQNQNNNCYEFHFNTQGNTLPLDSPPPTIETMNYPFRLFLRILSSFGLFFTISIVYIIYIFRRRRLVKMSQPVLSYFTLGGLGIAYIRVILTTLETTEEMCVTRLWFDHLGFQLIFTTLMIRSWRVYSVACSLKRTKVSDLKSVSVIFASIFATIVLLIATSVSNIDVKYVTVLNNQFDYIWQPACNYHNRVLIYFLYAYDGLILFIGLRFCWLIRNVASTVCNTVILVEGLVITFVVIVLTFVLLFVLELQPLTRQFIVSLVISLLVSRILWIFESQLIYQLMLGYELDRALILRKSEKSIFEINCYWKKFSNKVNSYSKSDPSTTSITNQGVGSELNSFPGLNQNQQILKGLEKYSKLKNKEELNVEVERIKEEIKLRQVELVCLENMMFASEQDSKSKSKSQSQSRKKSSHGVDRVSGFGEEPQQHNSAHSQESGIGHDLQEINQPNPNFEDYMT